MPEDTHAAAGPTAAGTRSEPHAAPHADPQADTDGHPAVDHEALNAGIAYTMYSVFRVPSCRLPSSRSGVGSEAEELLAAEAEKGVTVRGVYDLSGMRADADWMVWWHAPTVEQLQHAYSGLRQTALGRVSEPVWSATGIHRPAEFNRRHIPAFLAGEPALRYVCVYPFVRSYEWYLLPQAERRQMLADHGRAAAPFPDVRANTVSAIALGDYEWLLSFEADELHRIVDLMRALRETEARRHVREELPFFTGPRTSFPQLVDNLP